MAAREQLVSDTTPDVRFDIIRELSVTHASNGEQHKCFFRVCLAQRYHVGKEDQGEWVALKMPWLRERPEYRQGIQRAFEDEKRSLRNLANSDRVVRFWEDGRGKLNRRDAVDYMVLHYVDGLNLRDVMQVCMQPLTPQQVLGIACQLAEALQNIHDNGIVHCDLKPSNVMIDMHNQSVVLIDFGSVWFMEDQPVSEVRGISSEYMAPEQANRFAMLTAATDIYAFGVILYELFSGRRLFKNRTVEDVADGHYVTPKLDALEKGLAHNPALAGREAELAHILRRCLPYKPDKRPQSAVELMDFILDLFARELQI